MSGHMVKHVPQPHRCETFGAVGYTGSIWRCGECGWHWIKRAPDVYDTRDGWRPVSRRKQRKLSKAS